MEDNTDKIKQAVMDKDEHAFAQAIMDRLDDKKAEAVDSMVRAAAREVTGSQN